MFVRLQKRRNMRPRETDWVTEVIVRSWWMMKTPMS